MIRALKFTAKSKTPVYYTDFTTNLDLNPITDQIQLLTNEDSISNALKTLLLTNLGERFYHPEIGSRLQAGLFEMDDQQAQDFIQMEVGQTIKNFEKRVTVRSINTRIDQAHGGIYVSVSYSLINIPEIINTTFLVKRSR